MRAVTQAHVNTRIALLDAAEELFSQRGYAAVGIREIVEHAGANIASIKYHFGSKSELYIEAVRRALERPETAEVWEVLQETPADLQMAATMLVRFIHRFLARRLAPESPDTAASLILHEAAEPSEAIDSVVRDFIQPHEEMLVRVLRVLAPDADRRTLSLFAQGVLGQILHYRVFRPVLERMAVGDLSDPGCIARIGEHIGRFSLAGLGCPPDIIARALQDANELETTASRSAS